MSDDAPLRAHHDMGGIPRFLCEPVDKASHALTEFDRTVDAIRGILGGKSIMSVDELRANIEAIPEADHHALSYYERWLRAITAHLLKAGVITEAELAAALP